MTGEEGLGLVVANLREETTMATSAMPAAAVTPTATAVFQRPPCAPAGPRRPATARSARPHAHIGRRCPADRSTAPLRFFPRCRRRDPPALLPSIDWDSGLRVSPFSSSFFSSLSAILAVLSHDFDESGACVRHRSTGPCSWASRGGFVSV